MKKKLVALVLLAAMILGLCACASSNGTTEPEVKEAETSTTETQEGTKTEEPKTEEAPSFEFEEKTLTFSCFSPETTAGAMGFARFAEAVKEKTGGKVTVQVYYNGTLYNQNAELEALMKGDVDFISGSLNYAYDYIPELKSTFCPYMWKSLEHWGAFWETEQGSELMRRCQDEVGVRYLSWFTSGWRHVYLNYDQKVDGREALNGVLLRSSPADNMLAMTAALGANPIPVAFSDVYLSLETGVVNGLECDLLGIISAGLAEVVKSATLTHHYLSMEALTVSEKSWDSWSPELQAVIMEAAEECTAFINEKAMEQEQEARATLEEMNIPIYELTDEEMDSYRAEVVEAFRNSDFAKDYDMELFDLMNKVGEDF